MSCLGKIDLSTAEPLGRSILGNTIGNIIAGNIEQQQELPARVVNADGSISYNGSSAVPKGIYAALSADQEAAASGQVPTANDAPSVDEVVVTAPRKAPSLLDQIVGFIEGIPGDISNAVQSFTSQSGSTTNNYYNAFHYTPPPVTKQFLAERAQFQNYQTNVTAPMVNRQLVIGGAVAISGGVAAGVGLSVATGSVVVAPVLATLGTKSAVGFGLGYGGSILTGTQSVTGRLMAGAVGAIAVPGSSILLSGVEGLAARTALGATLSFGGGSGGEAAGELGDQRAGVRTSFDKVEILKAGGAAASAYLLFGEAALTGFEAKGLAADLTGTVNSAVGGAATDKLLGIGEGHK